MATDESNEEIERSAQQEVTEEIPLSILAEAVSGDPDLENSIKLAMKLQQREYERRSSSSDSSSSLEVCCIGDFFIHSYLLLFILIKAICNYRIDFFHLPFIKMHLCCLMFSSGQ